MLGNPVVKVENLYKHFGKVAAVDGISFDIAAGSCTALLGGNGAGKTTTIAMLLGLLLPDSGRITILGEDMLRDRFNVLPRINFSSPYVELPKRLTVTENLAVYAELYGLADPKGRIAEIAADFELTDFLDRRTGGLSAGQKTRVALAKSLLNKPEVLLLDEPTASLDPDSADWLRHYLDGYRNSSAATLLIASHNMTEVERLCDDVLMMRAGKIVDRDSPAGLVQRYGRTTLEEVFLDIARNRTNGTGNNGGTTEAAQ